MEPGAGATEFAAPLDLSTEEEQTLREAYEMIDGANSHGPTGRLDPDQWTFATWWRRYKAQIAEDGSGGFVEVTSAAEEKSTGEKNGSEYPVEISACGIRVKINGNADGPLIENIFMLSPFVKQFLYTFKVEPSVIKRVMQRLLPSQS